METNLFGMINGLNIFLPEIQSQLSSTPSAIVLTGSKQGITNVRFSIPELFCQRFKSRFVLNMVSTSRPATPLITLPKPP